MAHARRQPRDREPDLLQHGGEERVLLEAVSAARAVHQLRLQRRQVQPDRPPEEDIEVLERDVRRVREVQRTQHLLRRLRRALVLHAAQVRREVERGRRGVRGLHDGG